MTDYFHVKRPRTDASPQIPAAENCEEEDATSDPRPEQGLDTIRTSLKQSTLAFAPPKKKMRPRTVDEIYALIPYDELRTYESQCEPGCDCRFCSIYFGLVEDTTTTPDADNN